jgi:hypothetical protein
VRQRMPALNQLAAGASEKAPLRLKTHGNTACLTAPYLGERYRVRAAMNEARTSTFCFSLPEFGIRQVRTPGPREKYSR